MDALRSGLQTAGVRVSKYHDPSTRRVIVMERFDGTVAWAADLIAGLSVETRKASAQVLLKAVLGQILEQGVFHADLHAGNVLVWPDGSVGLLDFDRWVGWTARGATSVCCWRAVDADDPDQPPTRGAGTARPRRRLRRAGR